MLLSPDPITFLLVEADEEHALLIEENIRRGRASSPVLRFRDGQSVLDYLFAPAPRAVGYLVLLDLDLPDMSGVHVLERIKSDPKLRRVPVIVLGASSERAEIDHCYELGANAVVPKPRAREELAEAVQQLGLFFSIAKVPTSD